MRFLLVFGSFALCAFVGWNSREKVLKSVKSAGARIATLASRSGTGNLTGPGSPGTMMLPTAQGLRKPGQTWTFADGSQIEAVLVAADSQRAQFRVLELQGVGEVRMDLLADQERERIQSWIQSEGTDGVVGFPLSLKSHRWPKQWRDTKKVSLERVGNTDQWRSEHFDITNKAGIQREAMESITLICEAVDGALSSLPLPLPLNWGRRSDELRKIVIERSAPREDDPKAGYWDGRTGFVHIYADRLLEPDLQLVVFEFDKPEKAQKYDVIVHEVTHQSMAALIYLGVPAWVPEGIAEYMSATQFAPGSYHFTNTHVSIRHHINKGVLGDRIVKDRKMRLAHLEKLMNRDLREWNRELESGDAAGILQYDESLLLIDYFFHRDHPDGVHFRRYLECVLSGVPESEASSRHLLRGRSYRDIEQEVAKLWQPLGFTIHFQERGELRQGDVMIDWDAEGVKRTIASRRALKEAAQ